MASPGTARTADDQGGALTRRTSPESAQQESFRPSRQLPAPQTGLELPTLTGLRGVAATLVFLRHIHADVQGTLPVVAVLGNIGYVGVTFFFVLSGFVLTWATRPITAGQFYWRRFARVYPLYFAAIWIWLAIAWPLGTLGDFGSKPLSILPSLLLVQAWVPTQSIYFGWGGAVLWSLSCEAFFYLVFPHVYRRFAPRTNPERIRAALLFVLPAAAVACAASTAGSRFDLAAYANPAVRLGEFVLGVVLGLLAREGARATPWQRRMLTAFSCAWLVVPILLGYRYGHLQGFMDTLTLPAFAIIIFLAGTREADGRRIPVFSSRPLVYFGEISYAFYLIHPATLTISGELGWVDATTAAGTALAILADFALSFAFAAVLHHTVEGPARRWLMGVLRSRSSPRHAYRSLLPDVRPRIPPESASADHVVPVARP